MADGDQLAAAYAHCEQIVRETDRDRWLAGLFAPADKRHHLNALNAFAIEVGRVRDVVSEPMPGEIRLQWWTDVIAGEAHGHVGGHPVAMALVDTIGQFKLPAISFGNVIEARRFDLYNDPMPTLNDLEGYAGETVSALIQACAMVLCEGDDPRSADAAGHAGVAHGMVGLMRALPVHARRGQVFLPNDLLARHGTTAEAVRHAEPTEGIRSALAEMREHGRHHLNRALAAIPAADPRARPAFVGLGLIEPYIAALERQTDPFGAVVDVPAWRKPLALWRMSRRLA